jgi:para-aminobenzoate synthetase component 1
MISEIIIDSGLTHEELLDICAVFAEEEGTCLFFSGGNFETAKTSYLCLFPKESLWIQEKVIYHQRLGEAAAVLHKDNPWEGLKEFISKGHSSCSSTPEWVGYFGYELGAFSDHDKQIPYQKSSIPDAFFHRPLLVLTVEHFFSQIQVKYSDESFDMLTENQRKKAQLLCSQRGIQTLIEDGKKINRNYQDSIIQLLQPIEKQEIYKKKIEIAKELILAGDIYQVNLSQQFLLKGKYCPYRIFHRVSVLNPAPFMAFFRFPNFTIVSSSPERFLCKKGLSLETRPIKGTAPRGKTPQQDALNKHNLIHSIKERAELLMITDLMRNDLGKISQTGSVVTEKIWHCETYTNVFHLISVIRSKAKSTLHPIDLIRSAFPGGSITGCPKLRSMEVIHELEQRPRGIYTGSMGYISANGDFDFNIAIRTLLCQDECINIQLGGAIVADSDPTKECEEILYKGASIFTILGLSELQK